MENRKTESAGLSRQGVQGSQESAGLSRQGVHAGLSRQRMQACRTVKAENAGLSRQGVQDYQGWEFRTVRGVYGCQSRKCRIFKAENVGLLKQGVQGSTVKAGGAGLSGECTTIKAGSARLSR